MTLPVTTYQVIYTFPTNRHFDVCCVEAGSPSKAESEAKHIISRYGFCPVVVNVSSVTVAYTAEAEAALLNAQKEE